jgi:AcrR family transcriptional regulator
MAADGYAGMSMRRLAEACGVKVSTLYYYFPSKEDLLRDVIRHRSYDELMRGPVPVEARLAPRARLVELLRTIWLGIQTERPVWRLLIGESQRGDPDAAALAAELLASLEDALTEWLATGFPELGAADRPAVANVLVGQLLSFFVEDMVLPPDDRADAFERRAAAVATLVFPRLPRERTS